MVIVKDQKIGELEKAYFGLGHVPRIQQAVYNKLWALQNNGMDYVDALEQALIEHAFYKDTRPMVMRDAASEYEDILEGAKIWEGIQKLSGS